MFHSGWYTVVWILNSCLRIRGFWKWLQSCLTRYQLWPSGIVVACVCCVCVRVWIMRFFFHTITHHLFFKLEPPNLDKKMQNTLFKIPIGLGVAWPPLPWASGNPASGNPVAIQCAWNLDPIVHWNATGERIVGSQCVSSVLPVVFQWCSSVFQLCKLTLDSHWDTTGC